MGSKWYYALFVFSEILILSLAFFGQPIILFPEASLSINVLYAVSKAAGTTISINAAILLLVNCQSIVWLLRKTFGDVFNATRPVLMAMMIFSLTHIGTYLVVPVLLSTDDGSKDNWKALTLATLMSGVGWSGLIMLLLLCSAVSVTAIMALVKAPAWLASWCLSAIILGLFLLVAAHGAFHVPKWSDGSSMVSGSDTFWRFALVGAVIILIETVVLKCRSQGKVWESAASSLTPY